MGNSQVIPMGRQNARRGSKRCISLVVIGAALAFLLPAPGKAASSVASLLPRPDVAPETGALFGSYVKPFTNGWNQSDWKAAMAKREGDLGRSLDINHHYFSWNTPLSGWQLDWDAAEGRHSMISLASPDSLTSVTSGAQDAWLRSQADAVKALGRPVFIRWMWEMDIMWDIESPAAFVAAWRRARDIFDQRGATNALWTWCPTAYSFTTGVADRYYPGDAYVDWICADGYNWAPGRAGAPWRSFKDIFRDFYNWGTAHGKPLMVGETGTEERYEGEKAAWYDGIVPALKSYPNLKALVYFDTNTTDFSGGWFEWRPDSSQSAYTAYRRMAADPYLNTRLNPVPLERSLTVGVEGPGSVTAAGIGLSCTTTCTETLPAGSTVTLTAAPEGSAKFLEWDGACSGSASTCTVEMTGDRTVGARFVTRTLRPPKLTKPDKHLQLSSSITVRWDDEEELANAYELRTVSGSSRQLLNEATAMTQTISGIRAIDVEGVPGTTYCFAVRAVATDAASPWSERECTSVPLDDPSLNQRGAWSSRSAHYSYGGSYSKSEKRGARLVRRNVRARDIALLARSCRRCGKVRVLWNGRSLGRFSLRSATSRARAIEVASWPSVRTGTVKIVVASRHRQVRIDGLGISQS